MSPGLEERAAILTQSGMRLIVTDVSGWRIALSDSMQGDTVEPAGVGSRWLRIAYDALVEAAAGGAATGVQLALNVGGMLMAFIALIALAVGLGPTAVIIVAVIVTAILLVLVAVLGFGRFGTADIHARLAAEHPDRLDLLLPAGLLFAWNTGLFSMGEVFHNNIWWSRVFASRPSPGGTRQPR